MKITIDLPEIALRQFIEHPDKAYNAYPVIIAAIQAQLNPPAVVGFGDRVRLTTRGDEHVVARDIHASLVLVDVITGTCVYPGTAAREIPAEDVGLVRARRFQLTGWTKA